MSSVAIVTDSASDLPPEAAAAQGITVVPLVVSFGAESFRPNVDLTTDEFWERMTAPDAPFPTTAAASPGDFLTAFEAAFDARRRRGSCASTCRATCRGPSSPPRSRATCCPTARSTSSTRGRRRWASASWPRWARELAAAGVSAAEIAAGPRGAQGRRRPVRRPRHARVPEARRPDQRRARRGRHDALDQADHHRPGRASSRTPTASGPRQKARERVLELLTAKPLERAALLHSTQADVEEFRDRFLERSGLDPSQGPDDADRAVRRAPPRPGLRRRRW